MAMSSRRLVSTPRRSPLGTAKRLKVATTILGELDLVPDADVRVGSECRGARVSLEVRWVFSGGLPATVFEWLGPFETALEERVDCYLVDPGAPRISVKVRGAALLDLKVNRGSPGEVALRHGGRGRLELWEKLSFPLDAAAVWSIDGSRWVSVEKRRWRRSFLSVAGQVIERPLSDVESPGCAAELTEVRVGDDVAWTLAFEARGPSAELAGHLRTTVA
jgi:hypothetical protein